MKEESNVRRHVLNAFKEGELERDDNNVHFLHVNGVKKPVPFYSLDVIISVKGYAVIDRINKLNGSETIVIASQQYTKAGGRGKADVFSNAMKQDFKSKNPTTRWSDIIKLK